MPSLMYNVGAKVRVSTRLCYGFIAVLYHIDDGHLILVRSCRTFGTNLDSKLCQQSEHVIVFDGPRRRLSCTAHTVMISIAPADPTVSELYVEVDDKLVGEYGEALRLFATKAANIK